MTIEIIDYPFVPHSDKTLEENGVVFVTRGEGCGLPECNCSPGFVLSAFAPMEADRRLTGVKITFTDRQEMDEVLARGKVGADR